MAFCELRTFSEALGMQVSTNVILPDPSIEPPYHVMFLLHGLSDDHTMWSRRTSIERYVSGLPLMVVMPNGGRGFYLDAEQGFAYGKAIGEELPKIIRRYFPVRDQWAIAGLSMGGYGALRLALTYPELFRAAVSHSGAVMFGHHPNDTKDEWGREMARLVGDNPKDGPNDLYKLAEDCSELPALRLDCGTDDFLIEHNRDFHRFLSDRGIPHEYEEFSGAHEWEYWDAHVQDGLAFVRRQLSF